MSSLAKLCICCRSRTLIFCGRARRVSAGVGAFVDASVTGVEGCGALPGGGAAVGPTEGSGGCCGVLLWALCDGARGVFCAPGACCAVCTLEELGALLSDADMDGSVREGVRLVLGCGLGLCARGASGYG
jgi:hypothetical protein